MVATEANGFFSPLDPEIAACLATPNGVALDQSRSEDQLAAKIGDRLGMRQ